MPCRAAQRRRAGWSRASHDVPGVKRRAEQSRAAQLHSGNAQWRCSSGASSAYGRVRRWDSTGAPTAATRGPRPGRRPPGAIQCDHEGNSLALGREARADAAPATLHSGRMPGRQSRAVQLVV
ncbi:unnamed protein product [Urochloa humidicola]